MLTLEQSNELRSSVQKVQQFHQEVLKNKETEIEEYKNQVEIKEKFNESLNSKNVDLIKASAISEKSVSQVSNELASTKTELSELIARQFRLEGIFKKQRLRQSKIRKSLTPIGPYANESFLAKLPKLVHLGDDFSSSKNSEIVEHFLTLSDSTEWATTCYRLLIDGFGISSSYDMSDTYFENLIKPYLGKFNHKLLNSLQEKMVSNSQISDRGRAEKDLKLVSAMIASRVGE